jgi:hypothetical protein
MITIPAGARILLATRPIDLGKGAHGLAALAQEVLAEDPFSGALIVYRAKRSDRVRIPTKPATDSDANQPPVPIEASQAFRRKPAGVAVRSEGDFISFSSLRFRQA